MLNTKGNRITYFGHSTFSLTTPSGQVALIDPWVTTNPWRPDALKKRLKKKNAPGEKAINEDYLGEVIKAYEHFFFHYTSSDLLIVNTSDIDFVERNEDLQELLRKVSAPIKGTQYFLPLGSQEAASA